MNAAAADQEFKVVYPQAKIPLLNNALEELSEWCLLNTLTPSTSHEVRSHGVHSLAL